jgi:hypothetical protein
MVKRSVKSKKETSAIMRLPARRYGFIFFYLGLVLIAVALFINLVYIRPTNFKAQFKARQLTACLKTSTSSIACHKHFGN